MVAELERLWEKLPFESAVVCRQRAGTAPLDAVHLRAVAGADPSRAHRGRHRGRRRRRARRPTDDSPRCGCAAGSTGSNATARAASWSWTSRPARRPVSKDDAQRHAQLAMYQLAIAEGLLPEGDSPGGGRLVYLGKAGAAGPTEREQDALTPDVRGEWRELVRQAAAATQGPQFVGPHQRRLRALPGAAELPRPGGGRRNGDRRDADVQPRRIGLRPGLFAPTDEQAAVIAAPPGPLVVIAGAGAGKTETMAARVVWLVANGYASPGEVLGLTFTRKAAGQLLRRVRTRLARLAGTGIVPGRTGRGRRPGDGQHLPRVRRARCCASTACCCRSSPTPGCSAKRSCGSWRFASSPSTPARSTPTRRPPPSPRWCCGWPVSWPSTSSTPTS